MPATVRYLTYALIALFIAGLAIVGGNRIWVDGWAQEALSEDMRNETFEMHVRWGHYVTPSTLVIDLTEVGDEAVPADLWRGFLQLAAAAAEADRGYERVVLARSRTPVYTMDGDDFHTFGRERIRGQNPMYQLRTLPAALRLPGGDRAFRPGRGGLSGAIGEVGDAGEAARIWAAGDP